jgi:hypothetical protein
MERDICQFLQEDGELSARRIGAFVRMLCDMPRIFRYCRLFSRDQVYYFVFAACFLPVFAVKRP